MADNPIMGLPPALRGRVVAYIESIKRDQTATIVRLREELATAKSAARFARSDAEQARRDRAECEALNEALCGYIDLMERLPPHGPLPPIYPLTRDAYVKARQEIADLGGPRFIPPPLHYDKKETKDEADRSQTG